MLGFKRKAKNNFQAGIVIVPCNFNGMQFGYGRDKCESKAVARPRAAGIQSKEARENFVAHIKGNAKT